MSLRRRVGMVFQRWNPFPKSIYDNVAYGPRINGIRNRSRPRRDRRVGAAARGALGRSEGPAARERARLSGGQQQRLCIARALANEPEVLLLDEPASALDPIATQKVEELLYELKRELTIIIVTHNLQQAARVSDATAFFYLGRLVEVGPTDRNVHQPARTSAPRRTSPGDSDDPDRSHTSGSATFTTSSRSSSSGCSTCRICADVAARPLGRRAAEPRQRRWPRPC